MSVLYHKPLVLLLAFDLQFCLLFLVDLREAEHQNTVLFRRLSEVYVYLFREEDGAREGSPKEVLLIVAVVINLFLVLACTR